MHVEEPSLVRQLLDAQPADAPTPGELRGFACVPWGVGDMLTLTLFAALINLALAPFAVYSLGRGVGGASAEFFMQVLLSYSLLLAGIWLVAVRRHHVRGEALGFRPVDLRGLVGLLGLLALVIVVANVVVGMIAGVAQPQDVFIYGTGLGPVVLMGILVIVAAPVAEETFFRGFLLQGLTRRLRFWPAAILTSALFAVAHVWWQVYLPIFVLGMAFAWLFWRTGSLWAPIAAHATINATSFALAFFLHR